MTPTTPAGRALTVEERIERAEQEVIRLTGSGPGGHLNRSFRMTIPAEPDRDSDLVLMDGLAAGREAADAARAEAAERSLDALWEKANKALPDGWRIGELKNVEYRGAGERWLVMAWEFGDDPDYRTFRHAYGDTPAEAITQLIVEADHE